MINQILLKFFKNSLFLEGVGFLHEWVQILKSVKNSAAITNLSIFDFDFDFDSILYIKINKNTVSLE